MARGCSQPVRPRPFPSALIKVCSKSHQIDHFKFTIQGSRFRISHALSSPVAAGSLPHWRRGRLLACESENLFEPPQRIPRSWASRSTSSAPPDAWPGFNCPVLNRNSCSFRFCALILTKSDRAESNWGMVILSINSQSLADTEGIETGIATDGFDCRPGRIHFQRVLSLHGAQRCERE